MPKCITAGNTYVMVVKGKYLQVRLVESLDRNVLDRYQIDPKNINQYRLWIVPATASYTNGIVIVVLEEPRQRNERAAWLPTPDLNTWPKL